MSKKFVISAALLMMLAVCGVGYGGEVFKNPEGTFTCEFPEGFEQAPSEKSSSDYICTYYIPTESDKIPITVVIKTLGKTIGWKHLRQKDLDVIKKEEKADKISMIQIPWKGYNLDAVLTCFNSENGSITSAAIEIPIKKEAIKIIIVGPAKSFPQQLQYLKEFVSTIEGQTNWAADSSSDTFLQKVRPNQTTIMWVVAGLVYAAGIYVLWRISKKSKKGVVIVVSVVIWIAGQFCAKPPTPEMLMFGGVLKLLGTTGVILGIVDLFRKRKNKNVAIPNQNNSSISIPPVQNQNF